MKLARRLDHIEPFYVMACAKAAQEIARSPECDPARGGEPMLFLNIGEPDFTAPAPVVAAAEAALRSGRTQYTEAVGLPLLRERISRWYAERWGVDVPARRIVVTAGASAALQLVCQALFEQGDEVLMPDPSYPCNRHFVANAGATARLVPTTPGTRFQLDAAAVAAHWNPATRGVLLASPSNPTGTSIAPAELARIVEAVRARGGMTIVDEIYQGLSFDPAFEACALSLGEDVVSINSFSKYFCMTGWRLGWLVLPEALVEPVERLAQNLYICPSAVAQHAAVACFEPESLAECEARRAAFRARRDFLVPALERIGLPVPVAPDGAFYVWADCRAHAGDSWDFALRMMRAAHVALTPGKDFGPAHARAHVRLSFATALPQLEETVRRLARELR
ncbi:MAG TPA: pyridoxal phosphate-dependent aminotransferase [Burkholderiaceae bacterium]